MPTPPPHLTTLCATVAAASDPAVLLGGAVLCTVAVVAAWRAATARARVAAALDAARESVARAELAARLDAARDACARGDGELQSLREELVRERDRVAVLTHELAVAEARAEHLAERARGDDAAATRAGADAQAAFGSAADAALAAGERRLVAPLREALERLETRSAEADRARVAAHARLEQQVRTLAAAADALGERTTSLAAALRGPTVRGRWGELALRNVVEAAGLSEHCDFEEQRTTSAGGRPDLTVRLPGGRFVAVDAKAPLDAFQDAAAATTDAARRSALDRHVAALRGHVRALAARGYAQALAGDVDLVVLFLPGEPLLGAAFAHDPTLQEEALRARVVLATPASLVALLRTIAVCWQQRDVAENARTIAATARELYARGASFAAHLDAVGGGLRQAVSAYNRAAGSFETRFVPLARRLEELRAVEGDARALAAPTPLDELPRRTSHTGPGPDTPPAPRAEPDPRAEPGSLVAVPATGDEGVH